MEKQLRIFGKLALTAVLVILFIWLITKDKTLWQLKQPAGETARLSDVRILTMELLETGAGIVDGPGLKAFWEGMSEDMSEDTESLDYGTYKQMLSYLAGDQSPYLYEGKYRDEFLLTQKDWDESYEKLLRFYGLENVIGIERMDILCDAGHLVGERQLLEGELLGGDGTVYTYVSPEFAGCNFTTVEAYVRENRLLVMQGELSVAQNLSNVWVMECNKEELRFFDGTNEISIPHMEIAGNILADLEQAGESGSGNSFREQVADLSFEGGKLEKFHVKKEKAGGKLLGYGDGFVELEGTGILEMSENCVGYQLFDKLRMAQVTELSIGYSFSDFVLEDGKVCAFLITRKEKMENIRVAVKNNDSGSIYHQAVELSCEDKMEITYGEYDDRKTQEILKGETLLIEKGSEYLKGGRIEVRPVIQTGRIGVLSESRACGVPYYRGSMEIADTEEGLVLINELPLEEYLYSVVPSEMPASYPVEALKAQAVCARTYGYRYMEHPGYGSAGAHLDDSVSYQVYNNIAENVNSTRAVKETSGMILSYQDEPVNAYYYSTSCGFGADAGVWNEDQKGEMPYLRSVYIGQTGEGDASDTLLPESLTQEEQFREYILSRDDEAFEQEEAWFRWEYQVEELDVKMVYDRLVQRFEAVPLKILCEKKEGEFESEKPDQFKEIYDIRCLKRKEGGVMEELLIETDQGTYKVISEYNIRYVLNQKGEVIRQDGSSHQSSTLLPSAYMIIDVVKKGECVVGYTLIGGGYGHGVGMSQNGAKAMGLMEMDCQQILGFYFVDCQVKNIY